MSNEKFNEDFWGISETELKEIGEKVQAAISKASSTNPEESLHNLISGLSYADIGDLTTHNYKSEGILSGYIEEFRDYQKASIDEQRKMNASLEAIEQNTTDLRPIMRLLMSATDNQDKMLDILNEIFSLCRAHNQEEAKSMAEKIAEKIRNASDTVEAVNTLTPILITILHIICTFLAPR